VFGRLIEAITELGRTLRTVAEQLAVADRGTVLSVDLAKVIENVNDLVGQVRRSTALARLVTPAVVASVIEEIEQELVPLQRGLLAGPKDGEAIAAALTEPGKRMLSLRDRLVAELRAVQRVPWY